MSPWSTALLSLLLACAIPGYLAQHLKVCATPEPGFWMANGSADALWDLTGAWQNRAESPTFHGPPPSLTEWPLSGYAADSLFYIMTKMSEFTTYEVKFYATYTQALYATATSHECDVGYAPFSETPERAYCGETTPVIRGCFRGLNRSKNQEPEPGNACCVAFGTNMMTTTVGAIIKDSASPGALSAWASEIDLGVRCTRIMLWMAVGIIALAHIVWLSERTNPTTNIYRQDYIHGISDAMWSGFVAYDTAPSTFFARVLALLENYAIILTIAWLTSILTTDFTTKELKDTYKINTFADMPATWKACVPSPAYVGKFYYIDRLQAYVPPDHSLKTCMDDFFDGKADVVAYDTPILRYQSTKHGKDADIRVIEGSSSITLSALWAADKLNPLQNNFEQAAIQYSSDTKLVQDTLERYFPTGAIVETAEAADPTLLDQFLKLIVPLALLTTFMVFYLILRLASAYRSGNLNCGKRLATIFKNMRRAGKLQKLQGRVNSINDERDAKVKLPNHIQLLFDSLDKNGDGVLDGNEISIDQIIDSMQNSDNIAEKSLVKLHETLVHLVRNGVEDCISKAAFAKAYNEVFAERFQKDDDLDSGKSSATVMPLANVTTDSNAAPTGSSAEHLSTQQQLVVMQQQLVVMQRMLEQLQDNVTNKPHTGRQGRRRRRP